jgi:hypothetical protein
MSGLNEQEIEDGVFEDVAPPCVALVPLAQELRLRSKLPLPRPNPSFVTQLIATAEQVPQTRLLRRAAPADALSAYGAQRRESADAGRSTRQII